MTCAMIQYLLLRHHSSALCRTIITSAKTRDDLVKVTVPHRIVERIKRIKSRKAARRQKEREIFKGQLIISSSKPCFNHYKGQKYNDFTPQNLASGGWKSTRSKGDYFTINATQSNPAWKVPEELSTFESLGVLPSLIERLQEHGIKQPTNIQAQAIPPLLRRKNVICAAETGSGKTLAFLLPMLQNIVSQRELYEAYKNTNTPRGLVLTPSRELADQIFAVTKDLCDSVSLTSRLVVGGRGTQSLLKYRPQEYTDILITTPGVFSKLVTTKLYHPTQLLSIVLDEADTLLDDSFSDVTIRLLNRMKISSEKLPEPGSDGEYTTGGTQLALVSATMPRDLQNILQSIVPVETMEKVTTAHLHRVMPHVPQKFIRMGPSEKPGALLTHLQSNLQRDISTLVFVNRSSTACFLSYLLQENEIPNILFHGNTSERVRSGQYEKFLEEKAKVIVCTDIASRGLDTINAQHVINYDFPNHVSDYIHRVGRVGRVGSLKPGFVLSFLAHKWEVDTLWKIETSVRRTSAMHNVNANIKRKLVGLYERKNFLGMDPIKLSAS